MDESGLRDALKAIAGAATDALAALDPPGGADVAEPVAVETPDYHAQDLERIEAQTDATLAVIAAEAAADVARIEAAGVLVPDAPEPLAELVGDPVDAVADVTDETPVAPDAAPPIETPADVIDSDANLDAAGAALDALPQLDTLADVADDVAPRSIHWYKKPLFGGR